MKKTSTHLVYSTKKVAKQKEKERAVAAAAAAAVVNTETTNAEETVQLSAAPPSSVRRSSSGRLAVDTPTVTESADEAPPSMTRQTSTSSTRSSSEDLSGGGSSSGRHRHRSSSAARRSSRLGERTVKRLRPSPALLQSDRITVAQCVKTMVEKKSEATLLVDKNGLLTGILTDRDIAFKVVALGRNPKYTRVCDVMTPNPHCVASNASALDALKKMVYGQFRHLPVADNDKVVGILDIAKCLYEAIAKMEQDYKEHSQSLAEAVKQLEKQSGQSGENLFEKLREKLFLPTLSAILLERSPVPVLRPSSTALDAARLMLTNKTSAVMVCNDADKMVGIFTSKDLMRRVVGMDLDPQRSLLLDVMTANPFSARLNTTILETLHTMHNRRFLHVPVFDDNDQLVGLVDVLQATCAIVQQMGTFQLAKNESVEPLWNQIRHSFIETEDAQEGNDADEDDVERSITEEHEDSHERSASEVDHEGSWSELKDNDDTGNNPDHADPIGLENPASERPPDVFVYKLADWNGTNHRFTSSAESVKELLRDVQIRLGDHTIRKVHYIDDDGDHVLLFKDDDLQDAVRRARMWGNKYIRLIVLHRVSRPTRSSNGQHNDNALGIVYYAAAAAAIAGASFFLSRRR